MWDGKNLGHIYQIKNKVNGNRYIGFTSKTNYLERWKEHLRFSRCKTKKCLKMTVVKAIRKYGENAFAIESLIEDKDNLWLLKVVEPFLIEVLSPEYNSTEGGEGTLGHKHSEETKRKCGMTMRGKKHSLETRRRMSESRKGIPPTPQAHARAKEVFGHRVMVDGIEFISKNDAANYIKNKYGISRNTALRRIDEGSSNFKLKR